MGKHETKVKSDDWFTPKYIFEALECKFDLDVASPIDRSFCHVPANEFLTANSLETKWNGFIWMNPPYGHQRSKIDWINKFIDHNNGIALMPDRTSAPWWQLFAKKSDAVLFVDGKIKFIRPDGTLGEQPGNGTTLFALGDTAVKCLLRSQMNGLGSFYFNHAKSGQKIISLTDEQNEKALKRA